MLAVSGEENDTFEQFHASIYVNAPLFDKRTGFAEYELLNPRIRLDTRVGLGLNNEADNFFEGIGLSVLFWRLSGIADDPLPTYSSLPPELQNAQPRAAWPGVFRVQWAVPDLNNRQNLRETWGVRIIRAHLTAQNPQKHPPMTRA